MRAAFRRLGSALAGALPFRVQDYAWCLLIGALIVFTPETNYDLQILLVLFGVFQIAEPRLRIFSSPRGQIASVILKLVFSYLLVGYTHGIASPYHPIFYVPVIFAATIFELGGVIAVTAVACLGYFSFLLPIYVDWSSFELPPDFLSLMSLRAAFFAIVAFLVFEQAKAKRNQMERTEEAVRSLEDSNRSLRRAEASLRRTERLAALGQLTAGLAHELRNPLGTIRASAEMLTKSSTTSRPEVMTEMAGYIRSEVDRMNGLITSFLDFARPLQIHATLSDLRPVLEQVFREQSGLTSERGVKLMLEPATGSLKFMFDPDLVRIVLSNLVQNAVQASRPGQAAEVLVKMESDTVRIAVQDSGSGIQPEHLENIFNPFFTTKPQGVGLGLAIVSKIIDEHGGRISVRSDREHGTNFEIVLPKEQPD